jgi:hypothetical protein
MAATKQTLFAGEVQSMEQLQARYRQLHNRQIEAKANLKNAERQLAELRREAVEKYGTDSLDDLREKLARMKTENETKRHDYQASLDKIESDLADVEREFNDAESGLYAEKQK